MSRGLKLTPPSSTHDRLQRLNHSRPILLHPFRPLIHAPIGPHKRYGPRTPHPNKPLILPTFVILPKLIERGALVQGFSSFRVKHVGEFDVEDLFGGKAGETVDHGFVGGAVPALAGEGVPAVRFGECELGGVEAEAEIGVVLQEKVLLC